MAHTGTHPSGRKKNAAEMQSIADRTGVGKVIGQDLQSKADQEDMKKH